VYSVILELLCTVCEMCYVNSADVFGCRHDVARHDVARHDVARHDVARHVLYVDIKVHQPTSCGFNFVLHKYMLCLLQLFNLI
jgi:hypothetical protein